MTPPAQTASQPSKTALQVGTGAILVKALALFLVAVLALVLYKTTPLQHWFDKAGPAREWFNSLGNWGILIFIVTSVALILLGFPRLLLCPLAGALYGLWGGLTVSLIATMISYYIGFLWIRGKAHHGIDREALPRRLAFLAGDPGFAGVVIGRLLPVPGMMVTMALAISSVRDVSYLLGSLIGLIPEAIPAVMAGVMEADVKKWGNMAMIALACIVGGWLVLHFLVKRYKKKHFSS